MKKNSIFLTVGLVLPLSLSAGEILTPQAFLETVQKENQGIRGATLSEKSALDRASEGGLIFSTTLFANTQYIDDKKTTASIASQGDQNVLKVAELGLSQATRLGLSGKISYTLSDVTIYNTNPAYLPRPSYTDSSFKLELNQPLWQNGFGRQYRSMELAAESQAKASSYGKRYETQMLLFDAETKYWKLSAVREQIRILKRNLEETKKVLEFNRQKVSRNLTDATDLYQSQAQVKARTLDLQIALDEEKDAMRAFNAARNIDSDLVTEDLAFPEVEVIISKLEKSSSQTEIIRNDVKAAGEVLKATQEANKIAKEKILPDLSVFAIGSLNARENKNTDALTVDSDHPYMAVGVKFSLPLDFGTRSTLQNAYDGESLGAELSYKKRLLDQDSEWKSLTKKIDLISKRLVLSKELKAAQLLKLEKERERQKNGKSTTFQVFQFELEHLGSQLNLVQLQANALMLLAQEKTFLDLNTSSL